MSYSTRARITRKGLLVFTARRGHKGNPAALEAGRQKRALGGPSTWSDTSRRKVARIAQAWVYGRTSQAGDVWDEKSADCAARRFVLLTVTLSAKQMHTDQDVKRLMLMPFLRQLKAKHRIANYLWFAEKQPGTGNIHFHIILDRFLPVQSAQALWNAQQNNAGYIAAYRAGREAWHAGGFRYDEADARSLAVQSAAYREGVRTNWSNPAASTDIKPVDGAEAVMRYVTEYCTKGAKSDAGGVQHEVYGQLWNCNRGLSKLDPFEVEMTPELDTVIKAETDAGTLRKIDGERWAYYAGDAGRVLSDALPWLHQAFRAHWREQSMKLPSRRSLRRAGRKTEPRLSIASRKREGPTQSGGAGQGAAQENGPRKASH